MKNMIYFLIYKIVSKIHTNKLRNKMAIYQETTFYIHENLWYDTEKNREKAPYVIFGDVVNDDEFKFIGTTTINDLDTTLK